MRNIDIQFGLTDMNFLKINTVSLFAIFQITRSPPNISYVSYTVAEYLIILMVQINFSY